MLEIIFEFLEIIQPEHSDNYKHLKTNFMETWNCRIIVISLILINKFYFNQSTLIKLHHFMNKMFFTSINYHIFLFILFLIVVRLIYWHTKNRWNIKIITSQKNYYE